MWPWEHVVVAYLCFSLGHRAIGSSPRSGLAVGLLVIGALLPDLIDKPLAWHWNVFQAGFGPAHSLFLAIPLSIAAIVLAVSMSSPAPGIAFAVGYLSHLGGDLLPTYLRHRELPVQRVLWPLMDQAPSSSHGSITDGIRFYFERSFGGVRAGELEVSLLIHVGLVAFAIGLWVVDGMPGAR